MFALEDRPFLHFFPFFALFSNSYLSLNSVRPRPAASSQPAGTDLTHSPRIQYAPARISLLPASPQQDRLSPIKARTLNTRTHNPSKPFKMRTYAKMRGEGVRK